MRNIPKGWLYQPIEIIWRDAVTDGTGWELAKEFSFKEHELSIYHTTVGRYIGQSKTCLYICQSFRSVDGMCGGRMSIPIGCVNSVRRLK